MVKIYYTLLPMGSPYKHRVWVSKQSPETVLRAIKYLSLWKGFDKTTTTHHSAELGDDALLYLMGLKDVDCVELNVTNVREVE